MKVNKRTKTFINLAFSAGAVLKSKPGSARRFLSSLWAFLDEVPVKESKASGIIDVYGQPWELCAMCGEYVNIQNLQHGDSCPGCDKKKEK